MRSLKILVASDSVGETGENVARASLAQFNISSVKEVMIRYPYIDSEETIDDMIVIAKENDAIVVYTMVKPDMKAYMETRMMEENIPHIDVMGKLLEMLSERLDEVPFYEPGLVHQLDEDYFKKIEAIEFAVKFDDGKDVTGLEKADIVLIGVSRTSKTPLSQFLAHKKYKVMNVPVLPEVDIPKELMEIDPNKCVGLIIDEDKLNKIRKERLQQLGLNDTAQYAKNERIQEEIAHFKKIIEKIGCPVIDVSDKAIEETANEIIKYIDNQRDIKG